MPKAMARSVRKTIVHNWLIKLTYFHVGLSLLMFEVIGNANDDDTLFEKQRAFQQERALVV